MMFIVKRRSEVVRFGIFLALMGLMAYYVAGKMELWRVSRERSSGAAPVNGTPATEQTGLAESTDGRDFFADFRMGRERSRGALRETLKEVMESGADQDIKKQASQQYLEIGRTASLEDRAEAMVKAKGFEDVVVHLAEGTAQVVVKTATLTQQQFVQVVDMVSRITGVKASAIQVLARDR